MKTKRAQYLLLLDLEEELRLLLRRRDRLRDLEREGLGRRLPRDLDRDLEKLLLRSNDRDLANQCSWR